MSAVNWPGRLVACLLLAGAYFLAGKGGLQLAFYHPSATAVWAPTGISVAALLLLGPWAWPGVMLGAFVVNLTTAGTLLTSAGIAVGNTLEAVLAARLVTRFAGGRRAFDRAGDVFLFAFLAGVVSTTVAATIGVTTLAVFGFAEWQYFGQVWLTWWLGDAGGALVVAPPIILWFSGQKARWDRHRVLEGLLLLFAVAVVGLPVFLGWAPINGDHYPLDFLAMPLVVWAAFRFNPRAVSLLVLILAGLATWGTVQGQGPFIHISPNQSLLLLQAFNSVVAVTALALAAIVSERRAVEEQLRDQAVRDPLTGLANYRRLSDALEAELRRSDRTLRPFAVVLLDLDNLKGINDRYGHLVGSEALCRVARALQDSCRAIDTPARYGGDEFAVVLPETEQGAAEGVARRVTERLRADDGQPPLSVSFGIAVHPRDGRTLELLVGTADRALYRAKASLQRTAKQ